LRFGASSATVSFVKLRCLLVDDNEDFLASAGRLLESQGFEIVGYATSAAEAIDLVGSLEPDIALVDIELAEDDGIALAITLEASAPATRVVLISAYERDDLTELIADSPAIGFLPKSDLGADAITELLS
jgi:DNA-binding NarL/FixJ family response regulator